METAIRIICPYIVEKEYQNVVFMPFDDSKTQMIIDDDIMKKAEPLASFYQCIKELN